MSNEKTSRVNPLFPQQAAATAGATANKKKPAGVSDFRAVTAEIDRISKRIAANKKKLAKLQNDISADFKTAQELIEKQKLLFSEEINRNEGYQLPIRNSKADS